MKARGKIFGCLMGGVVLAVQASATNVRRDGGSKSGDVSNNPYDVIVRRNVFDLKDPPPPPPMEDTTTPPPPNVALTGIMTILGDKRALFMVQEVTPPGKPPKSAESYILTEGQRQGVLEVLEIDAKNAKVKIKNDGVVSTITFEEAKAGASGPGRGPQRGMMGSGRPFNSFPGSRRPGFNPNFNPQAPPAPLQTGKYFPRPG